MADRPPVLLVDAGGTLLTRTRPGLAARVTRIVLDAEGDAAGDTAEIRAAVLTSADPAAVVPRLRLRHETTRAAVAAALAGDAGDGVVLPGAVDLLRTAGELGWEVIVTSNAGPGTPALPDELGRHLSGVVESRDRGLVKEDPRFWTRLVADDRLDPHLTLVVGDHEAADRTAPAAAGLQSRLVGAGGLATLVADLRAAGPPPPTAVAVVAGDHEDWADRDTVPAPHLADLVTRVTRARLPMASGGATGTVTVVRRRARPPAVVRDGDAMPGVTWLLPARSRPRYTVPSELDRLLSERGLSLDGLPSTDRKHLLSMIREARTEASRRERTDDLLRFLQEERGKGGP